jgi:hypothetical protein
VERVRFKLGNATNRRTIVVCPETSTRVSDDTDAPDLSDRDADSR